MKIRTDFVTNSSSSSFTTLLIDSTILETWLKNNHRYSLRKLTDMLACTIDGDGTGYEMCGEIQKHNLKGVVELLLFLLDEEDPELCKYLAENREQINQTSEAKIYCASQFECDPPVLTRMVYKPNESKVDCCDLPFDLEEDIDDEVLLYAISDGELDSFTPEIIDRLIESDFSSEYDEYEDEDLEEDED